MAEDKNQRIELNKPSTPQSLHNAHNLFMSQTPDEVRTFDQAEFDRLQKERRAAVDAAEAKLSPPELQENWKSELEELDRRLVNQMTVDEADQYANSEANKYKLAIKAVETEIATLKDLLATPGLDRCVPRKEGREPRGGCRCSVCLFNLKIEGVTLRLASLKAKQQQSIRICGNQIVAAKELSKLRPRWEELKARDKKITNARRHIRNFKDQPLRQEHTSRGGFHLTND